MLHIGIHERESTCEGLLIGWFSVESFQVPEAVKTEEKLAATLIDDVLHGLLLRWRYRQDGLAAFYSFAAKLVKCSRRCLYLPQSRFCLCLDQIDIRRAETPGGIEKLRVADD